MTPVLSPGMGEARASALIEAMKPVLLWGIRAIRDAREAFPAFEGVARLLARAGEPLVLVCLACCVLWLSRPRRGPVLALAPVAADAAARLLAGLIRLPPPGVLEPGVSLVPSEGFSMPSGHAAAVTLLFATLFLGSPDATGAAGTGRSRSARLALAFALPLPFLAAQTYLGAVYPTDALAGWALGAILFCVGRFTGLPPVAALSRTFEGLPPGASRNLRLLLAAAFAFAMNAVYRDGSFGGISFGLWAGYALLKEREATHGSAEGQRAAGPAARGAFVRSLSLLVGLSTLALILVPLARVLPGPDHGQYGLFRFARFALAGFWAGYAVPCLFTGPASR